MTRLVPCIVAVALVAAAACVGVATPAGASTCASASGVTVVVDFGALGSGLGAACDAGSGEPASTRFAQAGYPLTYVQRQPGFVCRVSGAPASDPCVTTPPADAYWGLFWSDGKSGAWTYASLGVTSLDVPDGGSVALVWQQGTERRTPPVAAPVHRAPSPAPSPSPSPTKPPTKPPTQPPTQPPSTSATPVPTRAPSSSPPRTPSSAPSSAPSSSAASPTQGATAGGPTPGGPTPGATVESEPSDGAAATDEAGASTGPVEPAAAPASDETRLPTWVTLTVLAVLVASIAISTLAARRRRDGTGP